MKKKIRLFTQEDCSECKQLKEMVKTADIVALDDNVELTILEIGKDKNEWDKVMEKTGVYFVPHMEVTWGSQEVHISQLRDFNSPGEAFGILGKVLDKQYVPFQFEQHEIREKLKSLSFMQQLLFDHMNNAKENFTIIGDFINMSRAKLK
tara:strand:- start:219 stop:668 length:450 start_codon:yes stop_codon:yes gene_type:complete